MSGPDGPGEYGDGRNRLDDANNGPDEASQPLHGSETDGEEHKRIGKAFQQGDTTAFATILQRFGPLIRAIVVSYAPNDVNAQNGLYQEVCIRIWKQHSLYEERGQLSAWLSTLAHRHVRNCLARRASHDSAVERFSVEYIPRQNIATLLSNPERVLRYRRFLDRLGIALAELSERQARVFDLVIVREQTVAETAKELNVSRATVRSHLRHARARLRELLSDLRDELS